MQRADLSLILRPAPEVSAGADTYVMHPEGAGGLPLLPVASDVGSGSDLAEVSVHLPSKDRAYGS